MRIGEILAQIPPTTGFSITSAEQKQVVRLLTTRRVSPSAQLTLHGLNGCILQRCNYAAKAVQEWAESLLRSDAPNLDKSYYRYVLGRCLWSQGRTSEALVEFTRSYTIDPKYLHPRIDAVKLLLAVGQIKKARHEMSELLAANRNSRFPRDTEVATLSAIFDDLRQRNLLHN